MDGSNKLCASALAAWLAVQLGALLLSAWQVPLARAFPPPAEQLALHLMLAVQLVGAAMLMPALAGWPTAVALLATAWPFTALAAALSAAGPATWLAAGLFAGLWLAGLACWRNVGCTHRWAMAASAAALAVCLGGGLLWYTQHEFAGRLPVATVVYGPMVGGMSLLDDPTRVDSWIGVLAPVVTGSIVMAIVRRFRRGEAVE